MADPEFVPFTPRRLVDGAISIAPKPGTINVDGATLVAPNAGTANVDGATLVAPDVGTTNVDGATLVAPEATNAYMARPAACDHRIAIRNEAVRLAAIACGRALRHAIALHPSVIAAFVDDALRSAGSPQMARIRLHPDTAESACAVLPGAIGDDSLSPGDIWIDFDGASVGAELATRAELLVAAAAAT